MAVPASLTIQNSTGVFGAYPVPARVLAKQLSVLFEDIMPDAVKTGMLHTTQNVVAVAAAVKKFHVRNLVIDPVLRSSSGKSLVEPGALDTIKKKLVPLALIVTPNIPEAETLSGLPIKSETDMDFAAGRILDLGPSYVLMKGGHVRGPAVDTLYGGKTVLSFSTSRRRGEFHGTGCLLSSAIAVFIARGLPVEKAVEKAKQFVEKMLKKAGPVGEGGTKYFQWSRVIV
jgi:hydroxymethylpyrimidine/phosphomethylpyrimidine kinase